MFSLALSKTCLLAIRKTFVRPHLDHADIPDDEFFKYLVKKIQQNGAPAIAGTSRCTSRKRIYNKLVLESLENDLTPTSLQLFGYVKQAFIVNAKILN